MRNRQAIINQANQLRPPELAAQSGDAIAALAYATLPLADGLRNVADVADVLHELVFLAELLPQVSQQLNGFLQAQIREAGPSGGDLAAAVAVAALLAQVDNLAAQLGQAWRRAQIAVAGLAHDGETGCAPAQPEAGPP